MFGPDDIAPKRPPEGREWVMYVLFAIVIFGLFAAEFATDFDARKYGALMIFVLWAPMLVLHELGHALAARLVGWRVLELVIGFGKPVKRFQIGETRIELRMFPLEGFVLPAPRTLRGAPWKNAFVYFAGPGVELAFVAVAGWVVGFDRLLTQTEELGMVTLQAACVVAILGAAMNLAPFPVAGGYVSDGLGMLLSFRSRPEHYVASLAVPAIREAELRLAEDDVAAAAAAVEQGLATLPENPWLCAQAAIVLAARGDGPGALRTLEAIGQPDALPPAVRGMWLHARARIALESMDDDLLLDADQYASSALGLDPRDVALRITRGATLLERMRYPEASRILGDAVHDASHHLDRDRALAYLAILEARRDRPERARALLAKLQRNGAGARLVSRAAQEIEACA